VFFIIALEHVSVLAPAELLCYGIVLDMSALNRMIPPVNFGLIIKIIIWLLLKVYLAVRMFEL
jgi:hypothetical protein